MFKPDPKLSRKIQILASLGWKVRQTWSAWSEVDQQTMATWRCVPIDWNQMERPEVQAWSLNRNANALLGDATDLDALDRLIQLLQVMRNTRKPKPGLIDLEMRNRFVAASCHNAY